MKKILVIEDDGPLRNNICELLINEGYETEFAEDGKIGLKISRKFLPDLIICDVMMPEMDGLELLEELRRDPDTSAIPFIFLTAKVDLQTFRKGMNLGADDYLFKPFDLVELLNTVTARLKRKEEKERHLNEMQEQISLKIPHELRTPLVHILGYAEIIEEEEDIAQIKEMAKTILKSGNILHGYIEKLLLYQKLVLLQNNRPEIITKMTSDLTEDYVSSIISTLPEKLGSKARTKINFEKKSIAINELYIEQLIKELVENGLKFSAPESDVFVQGHRANGFYVISVTDTGIGMSVNEINSISALNKFGDVKLTGSGLGLGLVIVQKIAELHGGSLTIISEVGKFTTCEVTLALN